MKKPNIVLFVSDHFRNEALGNQAKTTPFIDEWAKEEAVIFSQAFCQNPVCVPSRCSFLSGRYPHVNGFRTMHHLHHEQDFNLLKELKKSGYCVYFGGKNDVFSQEVPFSSYCDYRSNAFYEASCLKSGKKMEEEIHSILHGFTQEQAIEAEQIKENSRQAHNGRNYYSLYQGIVDSENPLAIGYTGMEDAQIDDAIQYIQNYEDERPLCLYLPMTLPHPHYAVTMKDFEAVDHSLIEDPIRLNEAQLKKKPSIFKGLRKNHQLYQWSDEELKEFKHVYYSMVYHIDQNFKKIIQALKEKEIYDDTAIFLFSDHGDYAGEYEIAEINQNTFEDVLTNVPLVIKPQKGIDVQPRKCEELVELVDIPATVASLTGIELSESNYSRSLVPLLAEDQSIREHVFCEGGRMENEKHCMDGGHHPSNLYWARTSLQEKIPEHTRAVMIRNKEYKYIYRYYEQDEFYDLKKDPKETDNKIDCPEYEGIIQKMKNELLNHFVATADCVPMHRDERCY